MSQTAERTCNTFPRRLSIFEGHPTYLDTLYQHICSGKLKPREPMTKSSLTPKIVTWMIMDLWWNELELSLEPRKEAHWSSNLTTKRLTQQGNKLDQYMGLTTSLLAPRLVLEAGSPHQRLEHSV